MSAWPLDQGRSIFRRMSSALKFAAIGECMIEIRDLGATAAGGPAEIAFGGDSLNTALYLARLGRDAGIAVDYVTALGDDAYSEAMLAAWRAEGIGTGLVRRLPGRMPGLYAIRTDSAGERTFHYWRGEAAARELWQADQTEALAEALSGFEMIYLSGITLSIYDTAGRGRLRSALLSARDAGARIVFDSNYRPRGWPDAATARQAMAEFLPLCDIALPTFDDERVLFGDADVDSCADRIAAQGVGEIVVKLGAGGCLLAAGRKRVFMAVEPVAEVLDTTAAGDSFNAAYLASRLLGAGQMAAARAGHRLAGTVIQHSGAIIAAREMPAVLPEPAAIAGHQEEEDGDDV